MDRNSAITGGTDASDGYYDVDYTWTKATAGRNTIRKTTMVMPEGSTLTYEYLSTNSLHDADASRVTRVKVATTAVATYAYNGVGQLVGTSLPQPDVFMTLYDPADLDDYDRLDNFGRVTQCKWTRDLGTDRDFYHTSITWDRNGNVTLIEDQIHSGFDAQYTNDGVNRLTLASEGTWNGSSITSKKREQAWTLDQVGNWDFASLDRNGNGTFGEIAGEYEDSRTHNAVNELTARDTDNDLTDDFTLTYDNVGNLTDDGEAYEYVYDVWGRLREVRHTSTQALIADYRYNGLNFRITFHEDTEPDGDVDASDPKYHLIYDERWRLVATYRADDDSPKEAFVSHQAGLDGTGSSSYIDSVILRQRDANSGWVNAADGTMEERRNYCPNWRNDTSALLTSAGVMVEWGKFTAYGLPIGLPAGDIDSDFITDTGDVDAIKTWVAAYDVRADLDLDGDIDATDGTLAEGYEGWQLGWNELSHADVANRLGYAGYHKDINLDIQHVRNRVLEPHLGRWTRRDPLGYVDGMGLYDMGSNPIITSDPRGLVRTRCDYDAWEQQPELRPGECCACNMDVQAGQALGTFRSPSADSSSVSIFTHYPNIEPEAVNHRSPNATGFYTNHLFNEVSVIGVQMQAMASILIEPFWSEPTARLCRIEQWRARLIGFSDGSHKLLPMALDLPGGGRDTSAPPLRQYIQGDGQGNWLPPFYPFSTFSYTNPAIADPPNMQWPYEQYHKLRVRRVTWEFVDVVYSKGETCKHRQCYQGWRVIMVITQDGTLDRAQSSITVSNPKCDAGDFLEFLKSRYRMEEQ